MFGLNTHRPRLFESNVLIMAPPKAKPPRNGVGVYGEKADGRHLSTRSDGTRQYAAGSVAEAQQAMGMPWCPDWRGIAEAIPPAYTEWIGRQLIDAFEGAA
jgi:DNA (cytosine-5)-methyltransferase 1